MKTKSSIILAILTPILFFLIPLPSYSLLPLHKSITNFPHEYHTTLYHAIPFVGGNLSYYNSYPRNIIRWYNKTLNGSGVKIAIIDTGISLSSWFDDAKIIYAKRVYNTTTGCKEDNNVTDYDGHGTHVAGIVHAFAPGSELIILKASQNGTFKDEDIICAIEKAIQLNASIISLSLGGFPYFTDCSKESDYLCYYIYNVSLHYPSIIFSVAAGNEGNLKSHYQNFFKNKSVRIKYSYYAPYNKIKFFIRWYNTSKNIDNMTMLNNTNNQAIFKLIYNHTIKNYVIYYNPDFTVDSSIGCTSNQCVLYFEINSSKYINDTTFIINTTGFDYDFYVLDPIDSTLNPYNRSRTISSPGINPRVFTVGSVISYRYTTDFQKDLGRVSEFSSRGDVKVNESYAFIKPDIVMPGEEILSSGNNGYTIIMSGTSMATPAFSGVIALIKQILPSITTEELKEKLRYITEENAYHLGEYTRIDKGWGLVNITKLIDALPLIRAISLNKTVNLSIPTEKISIYVNITYNKGNFNAIVDKKPLSINESFIEMHTFNISNLTNAGNYTLNLTFNGEFLNSPIRVGVPLILNSNISMERIEISHKNSSYYYLNISIHNNGYNTTCSFTTYRDKIILGFNETKNMSFVMRFHPDLSINMSCINNIGDNSIKPVKFFAKVNTSNLFDYVNISIYPYIMFNYKNITYNLKIGSWENKTSNPNISIPVWSFAVNNTWLYRLNVNATLYLMDNSTLSLPIIDDNITITNPLHTVIDINSTNAPNWFGNNSWINITLKFSSSPKNISFIFSFLNNTLTRNITSNSSVIWKLNLSKVTNWGVNKDQLVIFGKKGNKTLVLFNKTINIDLIPPLLIHNVSYSLGKNNILLLIKEEHLWNISIVEKQSEKAYYFNSTYVWLPQEACSNETFFVKIEDIAGNNITSNYTSYCFQVKMPTKIYGVTHFSKLSLNISKYLVVNYTKTTKHTEISNSKRETTINDSIMFYPINATPMVIFRFFVPEGYKLQELKKCTEMCKSISDYILNGSNIYVLINSSEDPLIYAIYYKEDIIYRVSSSHSSAGGSVFIYTLKENKQNLTNTTIIHSKVLILNKTDNFISMKVLANIEKYNISLHNYTFYFNLTPLHLPAIISISFDGKKGEIRVYNTTLLLYGIYYPKNNPMFYCSSNSTFHLCNLPLNINQSLEFIIGYNKTSGKSQIKSNNARHNNSSINITYTNEPSFGTRTNSLYILLITIGSILMLISMLYLTIRYP